MKKSRIFAILAVAAALAVCASAQSLGAAAREQRVIKPEAPQSKVYTNDNLPTSGGITVVGTAVPAAAATASTTKSSGSSAIGTAAPAEYPGKTAEKIKADVQKQKDEISRLERELDISTREWKLRQAAYYADAGNQLRDPKAWADAERKYKDETTQKQQALTDAKQKLDDTQEQARKAGLPSSAVE